MCVENEDWIFLPSETPRGSLRVISARTLLFEIFKAALLVAVCAVGPMEMATAQPISAEQGEQNVMKPSDAKKKIVKSQNATSTKLVKPIYLGAAPYICTPSGFGHTSKCFLR
ncbi:hypothetical protein [Rhizobium mayense]|uniref:Uncharacterized protein n=1 Tax=Rhizobium mayense TaxID=1312184 RepID=A0ABT7JQX3_9HYPH|nr:hypothetical protein [Rhizobium mayense]MDL2398743.1 hypothetical protein [Rhizobium mayense]